MAGKNLALDGRPFSAHAPNISRQRSGTCLLYYLARNSSRKPSPVTYRKRKQRVRGYQCEKDAVLRAITIYHSAVTHTHAHTHTHTSARTRLTGNKKWVRCSDLAANSSSTFRIVVILIISESVTTIIISLSHSLSLSLSLCVCVFVGTAKSGVTESFIR